MSAQFSFDLPEPKIRQHKAPAGFTPFDAFPEKLSGPVALDLETHDPGLGARKGSSWATGDGFVCGFSVASAQGSFYVGLHHAGGNSDAGKALRWLRAQARGPDVEFVYANAIYDLGWLLTEWAIDPINPPHDVQAIAALLDEQRASYSLDALLRDYCGRTKALGGLEARARDIGIPDAIQHMRRLPTWIVAPYGEQDAKDTLELFDLLHPRLSSESLDKVYCLERECLLVGRDLKFRGVRVDIERARNTKADFEQRRDAAIALIKDHTGVNVTPWDNVAIAKALRVENPALELEKTSTGKDSIRQGVIDTIDTPVGLAIGRMRKMDKVITTFLSGYIEDYITKDGRIHADFHPLRRTSDEAEGGGSYGTVTGRWSSSSPNLTNIPRRDKEIGPAIRSCYLPEEDELWGKLDYRSQEPHLATHFAGLLKLPGAAEMVARYNAEPTLSLHKEAARLMNLREDQYDKAKAINLGIIYGMQGKRFCKEQGLPTKWITSRSGHEIEVAGEEGQELLDRHFRALPWIKGLAETAKEAAEARGYIKTILGRRSRFIRKDSQGRLFSTYKALNYIVQGSAADQMKTAQVAMRRAGIPVLVVVHDDANISLPQGDAGDRRLRDAAEIMAHAIELSVPSLAESKVGATWGDVG